MQCFHYKTATGNEKDKPRLQKDILSVIFDHSEPQVLVYGTSSAVHPWNCLMKHHMYLHLGGSTVPS